MTNTKSFAIPSSTIGRRVWHGAEQWKPYESRDSRTVFGGAGGAIPPVYSTLLFLPAYSPDFNPIEGVWKVTRRLCLHNRYFEELSEVVNIVESKFEEWNNPNNALRSLCAII